MSTALASMTLLCIKSLPVLMISRMGMGHRPSQQVLVLNNNDSCKSSVQRDKRQALSDDIDTCTA